MEQKYKLLKKFMFSTMLSTAFLLLGANAELILALNAENSWLSLMYTCIGALFVCMNISNAYKALRIFNTSGEIEGTMRALKNAMETLKQGTSLNELHLSSMTITKRPDLMLPVLFGFMSFLFIATTNYISNNGPIGPTLGIMLINCWGISIVMCLALAYHTFRTTYYAAYSESFNAKVDTINRLEGYGHNSKETLAGT